MVVQVQVHLDSTAGRREVERVRAQHVLEPQQSDVRAQRHLTHAVRVEIKLVLDDLHKVLINQQSNQSRQSINFKRTSN